MENQLKKIFSDTSRQIPTKSEGIMNTEKAFMTEEINYLFF